MDTQLIDLNNIHSLTEFKRNTTALLDELRSSGLPLVLTVNGKAALVVQDASAYQQLLDAADQAAAIKGIRRGLDSIQHGEGKPADDVFSELRAKYDIPSDA